MVPCLVTLNDLYTRRAGLSASAELLVSSYNIHIFVKQSCDCFCLTVFLPA